MIKTAIIALVIVLAFTVIVQVDVMRDQLYRMGLLRVEISQLEKEVRQGKERVDELLEEIAGIKIEKVPDELLIH